MPGPWRRNVLSVVKLSFTYFNLRRDAKPLATAALSAAPFFCCPFQSQTRCQAPGDGAQVPQVRRILHISISDEMPGPWRRNIKEADHALGSGFQSQTRCQAPGDALAWDVLAGLA